MASYARQLVVQAHSDATIALGTKNLNLKFDNTGTTTRVADLPVLGEPSYMPNRMKLQKDFTWLGTDSRLYIRGHGSWINQTVGGINAEIWVTTLGATGMPHVKRLSICACQAGRDLGSTNANRITNSANSFASQFHRLLSTQLGWKTDVYARVYNVIVRTGKGVGQKGQKFTTPGGKANAEHRRSQSKLRFYWDGSMQRREWVEYEETPEDQISALMAIDIS